DVTVGGGTKSDALFNELRAKTSSLNTRQIVFISPPEDSTQANPKGKIGSDAQFHDPWGAAYLIEMDADYDHQVANPYGGSSGAGPDPLRQGVIAWSIGKNGGQATTFTNSDDVISWQ